MRKLSWLAALVVFAALFASYSYRLGIQPLLMHDDYEYTYPSFSLAEHGNLGSPLLGPGLNIQNRTYNLIVYYYALVHSVLIRLFGTGPESIPLANTFHFALLAAVVAWLLIRLRAGLGACVFVWAMLTDDRMVEAARHGRPEMTASFCLTVGVAALWLWLVEGRRQPIVMLAASAAFTAAMLSHTSTVFFSLALATLLAIPLARSLSVRDAAIGVLPCLAIPLLYAYFVLTDDVANLQAQLASSTGDVVLGRLLWLLVDGQWARFADLAVDFVRTQAGPPLLWAGVLVGSFLPRVDSHPLANGVRFFARVYVVLFLANFAFLKHFVLSYRVVYQAVGYMALALLAEVVAARLCAWLGRPGWITALRLAGVAAVSWASVVELVAFREGLHGRLLPYSRLQGALTYALAESGARPGDRVFVPSPFGFHLRRTFDVVAHPAPKYFRGRWSAAFRDGLRETWGAQTLGSVDTQSLCYAMGLAFIRPTWVMAWDGDYSTMQPFYQFLRKYPDVPGIRVTRLARARLPAEYGGTVRVYRLDLSDAVRALDRTTHTTELPCP